eukprot:TRINITY_DN5412_c0_g1_i1.p1 TRINITY_DN5412_c0_g1~~TRINITY_DN5412_c0_g1_i1.p1  ORF type:complete len:59 (-),score=4.60 TRINITY_DN5412_c0_g1_i1:32-208(-)
MKYTATLTTTMQIILLPCSENVFGMEIKIDIIKFLLSDGVLKNSHFEDILSSYQIKID